jgi:hypothetical protein
MWQEVESNEYFSFEKKQHLQSILQRAAKKLMEYIEDQERSTEEKGNMIDSFFNTDTDLKSVPVRQENGSQNIQERPTTPFVQSFPDTFYPGIINPLKKRVMTKQINIDSRFRENYKKTPSTNFQVSLPFRLSNVVTMTLSTIEYSNSMYIISAEKGNNFLRIQRKVANETLETMLLELPNGNYSGTDLISCLNNFTETYTNSQGESNFKGISFALNSNALNGTNAGSGNIVVSSAPIVFSTFPATNKNQMNPNGKGALSVPAVPVQLQLTFPLTPVEGYHFVLDFASDRHGNPDNQILQRKLGWILGFRKSVYGAKVLKPTKKDVPCDVPSSVKYPNIVFQGNEYEWNDNDLSQYYVSEGLLDLTGNKYIYLLVNDFQNNVNNSFYGIFQNSLLDNNILARIPIIQTFFNHDSQTNLSNLVVSPREYFGPVDIQKLQIQLVDEYGIQVNLNNMDFSFVLTFQYMYDL